MQTNKLLQKINYKQVIGTILLLFAFIFGVKLCSMVELIHIDDIMYAEWTKHGLGYFIEKNIWHYNNYNGRAFIHMCLQIILIFGDKLFPLVAPICLSVGFYLFYRTTAPDMSVTKKLFATSLSLMLVWSLGARYLESTVLWMSGTFNYIFPFLIVSISYALFAKNKDKSKISVLTIIMLFLSGATTEQYGMITIGLITLSLFFDFIDKKKIGTNILRYLLPSVIGYLSIILSPGTFTRLFGMNDFVTSNNYTLADKFSGNCDFLFGFFGNIFITVALFFLIGIVAIGKNTKYSKLCISGIFVGAIVFVLNFTVFTNIKYVLCVMELIFLCFALCKKKETREQGKLLICGSGSFLMMSVTMNYGTRTCLPFILLAIVLGVIILKDISFGKKNIISYISFALVFLICYSGYITMFDATKTANVFCKDVKHQLVNAKTTKEMTINLDETLSSTTYKHRHLTLFDTYTKLQFDLYQKYFEIPDDTKVYFISKTYNTSSIKYNNKYCLLPAITKENEIYIPFKAIYLLDTKILYDNNETKFEYNGRIFKFKDNVFFEVDVDNNVLNKKQLDGFQLKQFGCFPMYLKIEDFCEVFNLEYMYDKTENTYCFSKITK